MERHRKRLDKVRADVTDLEAIVSQDWPKEAVLAAKRADLDAITAKIEAKLHPRTKHPDQTAVKAPVFRR